MGLALGSRGDDFQRAFKLGPSAASLESFPWDLQSVGVVDSDITPKEFFEYWLMEKLPPREDGLMENWGSPRDRSCLVLW